MAPEAHGRGGVGLRLRRRLQQRQGCSGLLLAPRFLGGGRLHVGLGVSVDVSAIERIRHYYGSRS